MLNLLKSELKYNLTIYILYFTMLPIFYTIVLIYENDFLQGMIMGFFPFMLINQIISQRNKEFRERLLNTIPINRELLGIHRLLLILVPMGLCFFVLSITSISITGGFEDLDNIWLIYGFVIVALSLYFIIRDVFLSHLREKGITKNKMLIYLMLIGLSMNILGVVVFMLVKAGYEIPIKSIFEFFKNNNPIKGEYLGIRTIAFGLMISVLSIYSYNRNRSYME